MDRHLDDTIRGERANFYKYHLGADGVLVIEVLRKNLDWRRRLLAPGFRSSEMLGLVRNQCEHGVSAAVKLKEIVDLFPVEFEINQVRFTSDFTE